MYFNTYIDILYCTRPVSFSQKIRINEIKWKPETLLVGSRDSSPSRGTQHRPATLAPTAWLNSRSSSAAAARPALVIPLRRSAHKASDRSKVWVPFLPKKSSACQLFRNTCGRGTLSGSISFLQALILRFLNLGEWGSCMLMQHAVSRKWSSPGSSCVLSGHRILILHWVQAPSVEASISSGQGFLDA